MSLVELVPCPRCLGDEWRVVSTSPLAFAGPPGAKIPAGMGCDVCHGRLTVPKDTNVVATGYVTKDATFDHRQPRNRAERRAAARKARS